MKQALQYIQVQHKEKDKVPKSYIITPWGLVESPFQIFPHFYCPLCDVDLNVGDCSHRKKYMPPVWIKQYGLWKKGRFSAIGEKLRKFLWLRDHAEVFNDGFESNDYSAWTSTTTTGATVMAVQGVIKREGSYASEVNVTVVAGSQHGYHDKTIAGISTAFFRLYYQFDTAYANDKTTQALVFRGGGSDITILDYDENAGTPQMVLTAGGGNSTYTVTLSVDTWYSLEIKTIIAGAPNGDARFWLDGTERIVRANLNTGATDIDEVRCGIKQPPGTAPQGKHYWDSVIVDNADYIGPIAPVSAYSWGLPPQVAKMGMGL